MTEKLYYLDPYMQSFEATVLSCEERKDGSFAVVTDRSAFYPEGGGQWGDTGTLGGIRVSDTHEKGEDIVHYCEKPLAVGSRVEGNIDFERRFDLMQQHSGEHIVSGIVERRFGGSNVGFHMGAELITIDFDVAISPEELREIEDEVNGYIWRNLPFKAWYPSPEELEGLRYRSKKALSWPVRIVECLGADSCACCGTHVRMSGEIGLVRLLSVHPFRSGVRVEMLSGRRAFEHERRMAEQNSAVSALLSAPAEATAAAAEKLLERLDAANYRLVGLENRLFEAIAGDFAGAEGAVIFEPGLDGDGLRRLADCVMSSCRGLCAVFSGEEGDYKYVLCRCEGDIRALVKGFNSALSGRGGGKLPNFAQGSVKASREKIEEYLETI